MDEYPFYRLCRRRSIRFRGKTSSVRSGTSNAQTNVVRERQAVRLTRNLLEEHG
jgi:hypothetical protein